MSRGTWLPAAPQPDHPDLDDRDATGDPYWALAAALQAYDAWDGSRESLSDRAEVVRGLVEAARELVEHVWDQDRIQEEQDTPPGTVPPAPIADELAAKYGWQTPLQRFLDDVAATGPRTTPVCMTCGDSGMVSDLEGNTLGVCSDCPA